MGRENPPDHRGGEPTSTRKRSPVWWTVAVAAALLLTFAPCLALVVVPELPLSPSTVASAPAAFRVRVWEIMSRGWSPRADRAARAC